MAVLGLLVCGVMLGSSFVWMRQTENHPCGIARLVWTGLATGGVLIALLGVGRLVGSVVWVMASAVLLSSPRVLQLAVRASRRAGLYSPGRKDKSGCAGNRHVSPSSRHERQDTGLPRKTADCSDDEILRAWQQSYAVLQQPLSPTTRMAVVNLRAAYLDELELRNPSGVSSWLASTPQPASDVSKYQSRGDDPPTSHTAPASG